MDEIRFGLVGCGRVSTRHVDALMRHVPGARLAAVCDVVPDRAGRYAAQFGIPAFESAQDMYRAVDLDVVDIATPSGDHYARAMEALAHDKHVVVEKPVALRPDHAEEMIAEARRRNRHLWVAHQNRYNRALSRARREVASGRLGKAVLGTVRVRWCRDQSYYDFDDWHGTWQMDGGVVSQQAIHHLDALLWCMGDVEHVDSTCATRLVRMECEDLAVATLRFRSGALGIIEATTATRPTDIEASLSVLGEGGVIVLGGLAMNRIEHWDFAEPRPYDATVKTDFFEFVPSAYGFGHDTLYKRVVASIRGGGPVEVPGEEGLRSIQLLHAIYASHERAARVTMSDRPASARLGLPTIHVRTGDRTSDEVRAVAACVTNAIEPSAGTVAGIIGELPSKTAKSPHIWNHALKRLAIDATFLSFDTPADALGDLVAALRAWKAFVGGSVAMPYKIDIIRHLDDLTPAARAIGAVNTIVRRGDGGLVGDNTDGAGAIAALTQPAGRPAPFMTSLDGARIVLVGAGGAGLAVAVAVAGAMGRGSLVVTGRTPAHVERVARAARDRAGSVSTAPFSELTRLLGSADLLINCSSCGQMGLRTGDDGRLFTLEPYSPLAAAAPGGVSRSGSDADTLRACIARAASDIDRNNRESLNQLLAAPASLRFFDIVYAPLETVMLRQARLTGHASLNGKYMNIQQAVTAMFDVVLRRYFETRGVATDAMRRSIVEVMTEVW